MGTLKLTRRSYTLYCRSDWPEPSNQAWPEGRFPPPPRLLPFGGCQPSSRTGGGAQSSGGGQSSGGWSGQAPRLQGRRGDWGGEERDWRHGLLPADLVSSDIYSFWPSYNLIIVKATVYRGHSFETDVCWPGRLERRELCYCNRVKGLRFSGFDKYTLFMNKFAQYNCPSLLRTALPIFA